MIEIYKIWNGELHAIDVVRHGNLYRVVRLSSEAFGWETAFPTLEISKTPKKALKRAKAVVSDKLAFAREYIRDVERERVFLESITEKIDEMKVNKPKLPKRRKRREMDDEE